MIRGVYPNLLLIIKGIYPNLLSMISIKSMKGKYNYVKIAFRRIYPAV